MSTNTPHRDGQTILPGSSPFHAATDRRDTVVVNAAKGGQHGFVPDAYAYVSEHPHIMGQGWCFVMSTPELFSKLPGGPFLHTLAKSWFETRARQWQGPTDRTELDFGDIQFSGRTLSVPIGGTRTIGPISFQGYDVSGEVYTMLHNIWVKWLGYDVDLAAPRAVILDDPGDLLIDKRSATLLMFNTTENMRDISHAALCMAVMPRSTHEIVIRRNKEESGVMTDLSMEYTSCTEMDTLAVRELARKFLKMLPLYNNLGTSIPKGFGDRTAVIESIKDTGIIEQMKAKASKVSNKDFMI